MKVKTKTINVTFTVPITVFVLGNNADEDMEFLTDAKAFKFAQDFLNQNSYSDGRYDFCEELIAHGIEKMCESAFFYIVPGVKFEEIHGKGCMVEVSPGAHTSKWILEAEKIRDRCNPSLSINSHNWNFQVEEAKED